MAAAVAEVRCDSVVCLADVEGVSPVVLDTVLVLDGNVVFVVADPVVLAEIVDGSVDSVAVRVV